jgi:hypothetical protein
MKMAGRKGTYNQDMIIISIFCLIAIGVFISMNVVPGTPEYFLYTFGGVEPPDPNGGPGPVEPIIEEEVLVGQTGHLSEGASTDIDFEVPWNTTVVLTVTLDWSDDIGDNDEFEVVLSMEGEVIDRESSTDGNIELTNNDPQEGNYTVTITAVDCPGMVGPSPIDRDTGNDWSLEVRAEYEVVP